ncbi:MAG: hypothetical protein OXG44_20605 [Gammaproteobacteria bacterium]|nr:hypothetical protein [Gammaproteobacteria bacterium]
MNNRTATELTAAIHQQTAALERIAQLLEPAPAGDRRQMRRLADAVADNPGINARDLRRRCGVPRNFGALRDEAETAGFIRTAAGPQGAILHYPGGVPANP